ncbi:hypothetical protein IFM89_031337 [Coptis chinensis]|uniref:Uncharacterized protein n=1 Tax=Coptis chinensis TaxID=261450 RepID=A0A835IW28_9MAGN|nr:hypothetical protein IFM89_031337 [Coptis chinensis]
MAATSLHLLLILLFCSQIISMSAVPISRTRTLLQESQIHEVLTSPNSQGITEDTWEEELINGRMILQNTNDYPGSGANGKHTPKSPSGN